jgi:hypothetical protein
MKRLLDEEPAIDGLLRKLLLRVAEPGFVKETTGAVERDKHLGAVRSQEREHAACRDQVPGQQLGVGKLPVHPLEALHETIIPEHRTPSRQTCRELPTFSAAS